MHTRKISFENASGHQLAALLDLPAEGEPVAYALFAHCFTCSKDYKGVVRISRALAAEGIAVLRFDFTGLGESGGDFADTNFSSNVADLVSAAEFMGREFEAPSCTPQPASLRPQPSRPSRRPRQWTISPA